MTKQNIGRRTLLSMIGATAAVAATGAAVIKPATASAAGAVTAKSGPTSVVYIEVNNNSMLNAGKYTLSNGGDKVFDVAVIFAANINYNTSTQKAYLYFNDQVTAVLNDAQNQIKPLQDKGIKVLLSILGNHQGAGFANFPSQAAAADFADQLANAVTTYGLDGIDFDDEYTEYGNNGTGQPNASSFYYLVTALRNKLGSGKLITLYDIGPSADRLSYAGNSIADTFDYSWNPYYGTWSDPRGPSSKSRRSPAAVQINSTSTTTAANFAQRTVNEGYGVYLTYDLGGGNSSSYISSFTQKLYGSSASYTP
ncbi:endo-beta-N-acetylglucosaminidase H [Psychromicrobium sp. YIM B11713]|uniref:endo-beta-N-acetylglucosaminidase H n=1 Tax=Psychromicrobium sp. YIM B11713 TaxID=3145233 RepID=UPI00374E3805